MTRRRPQALLAAISSVKIARLFLPVVMLERLAEAALDQNVLLPDLKEVSVAGEQLRITPAIRRFFDRMPSCRLWNHYGPTETHVVSSLEIVGPASSWPELPSIGRPLPGCQIFLLDEKRDPVPCGVIGEIYVGGVCLSRGYHRRPDLTSDRFVLNPWSAVPWARLYRTGDLARWHDDGQIEFVGRADRQVKIRSFRVEPGEIEAVLAGHPRVASCAITASTEGDSDIALTAFVVPRDDGSLSVASLREWLGERLPDYMIPSRYFGMAALPVTSNGKVDLQALNSFNGAELVVGTSYRPPRSQEETTLSEIWQTVLGRERVGASDNFFDLGGQSLLAAVICSRINTILDVEVPVRWLLEQPTIEGLLERMTLNEGELGPTRSIELADRSQPLAASFGQQGLWLLNQMLSEPATYNQPIARRLDGAIDPDRVRRGLRLALERHEILRTALLDRGGELVQLVIDARDLSLPWREVDLRGVPGASLETTLKERLEAEARRPFDLAVAPLWRVLWVTLADNDHVLEITFHHSIIDQWSIRLLFQELALTFSGAAIPGAAISQAASLPELPVQYADYAAWQRRRLTEELRQRLCDYWSVQLADVPPMLKLPADRMRPLRPSGRGAVHDFPNRTPAGIHAPRSGPRRINKLVHSAARRFPGLALATYRADGRRGRHAGRQPRTPEVQSVIGYFLNALPIRVRLDPSASFRAVLRQVRQTLWGALPTPTCLLNRSSSWQ